ncbi:Nuclease domain-containing protein 1 [Auxenochlorella protothecoides]|uniref:Ribonuclease n=1 Tax=Auxenochlorella protothecoides TaxID=3075 RepID=A0A087SNJ1_AUXPR|nr:Nuclease domain-containing protein 1 [Auxenochlorella protothecoides]KFM27295.1 Nuclease domain-containing protein 1 [Auxenochlorella protothecoides]
MAGQQGWLRGVVKEVLSGDTLVVAGAVKSGIPPEKRLTLASLIAPRLGRRDGSTPDEPFAWDAREFLRKLTVGKPVVFRVEYTLDQSAGREFGSVFLNERDNVAVAVVAAGYAKVRPAGGQQSAFYENLARAQEQAEAKALGLWTKDAAALEAAVRDVTSSDAFDAASFLAATGKGKPVQALVEAVISGSMLRATLLPSLQPVAVMVAGVAAPSMGKRPDADAAEGAAAPQPEAGAREAKHFTEVRTLQREVKLTLEGVSQFGVLVASVSYPVGESGQGEDLASGLLQAGLARGAEWSLNMMPGAAFHLREAERAARQARVGVWHAYVPPPTASAKLSDDFQGTVTEVVSGDCLMVRDAASGVERRVTLSSIRTPRMGGRDRAPEAWAAEARELLRSRLIGRPVRRLMAFGSVLSGEGEARFNAAELLLQRGLAQLVRHRAEEERSAHYAALVAAEEAAKAAKRAQWGAREAPAPRRAGKVRGVVEHVLSANRLKVSVAKEGVTLAFSPSGVRCPARGQAASAGRAAVPEEPYWAEALAFVRDRVLQRDVVLEVEGVDRIGTFLGTLHVPAGKLDLGAALLAAGLAKLHPSFDASRHPELAAAEEAARSKKLKVWEKYEAPVTGAAEADEAGAGGQGETLEVVVTEVQDATSFYFQNAAEPRVTWIADELAALDLGATPPQTALLRAGDKCVARYEDGQWYRASVERVHAADPTAPEYDVYFVDFGNRQRAKGAAVRPMDAALAAVAPQATPATLAFVKAPGLDDEYGVDAASMLAELVGSGAKLSAVVESRERVQAAGKQWAAQAAVKLHLTLRSGAEGESSVNAKLVAAGLARLAAPKGRGSSSPALEEVRAAQDQARRSRVGLWRYGDPGSDSEEEGGSYPKLRSAGPRR